MSIKRLSAVDIWKETYEHQAAIKADLKDCISCACPITDEDYEKYKMCPWCYSQLNIEKFL